jgi:hypothetical protein
MKIISKIVLLSSFLYLIGCSENTTKENTAASDIEDIPATEVLEADVSTPIEKVETPVIEEVLEEPKVEAPETAAPRVLTQESKKAAVVLNPPHGQPGHDCAIPVGEPLNGQAPSSAPINIEQAAPQTTAPSIQLSKPQAPAPSSVRLNPPHGQPGHDCAVQVGAPLDN